MKRRNFIKNTSLATAGVLSSPYLASCAPAPNAMSAGFQVYTVRNEVQKALESTLEEVAGFGYNYAEVYGLYANDVLGYDLDKVKKAFKNAGLDIRSAHCLTGAEAPDRDGTMRNDWQKGVDAVSELGAQYVVCAYLIDSERQNIDQYKELAELLNRSGELSKKNGIQLAYHNHDFEFMQMDGQVPYDILLSETDPDLVKMEMDIYWVAKAGKDPIEMFEENPGRYPLWHVKDMEKGGEERMTEVGNGTIDWKKVFANAEKSGMENFFVEQDNFWAESAVKSLETSYNYLKSI